LQAAPAVAAHPDRHSLLLPPSPRPFVVPGARFREQYYWDTLWALRGMLACGLAELARVCGWAAATLPAAAQPLQALLARCGPGLLQQGCRAAYSHRLGCRGGATEQLVPCVPCPCLPCLPKQGVVCNMLGAVEQHGFVPNGFRSYYLNRSQPPLLSQVRASRQQPRAACRAAGKPAACTADAVVLCCLGCRGMRSVPIPTQHRRPSCTVTLPADGGTPARSGPRRCIGAPSSACSGQGASLLDDWAEAGGAASS
jgi:hypothetical protein